MEEEITLQSLYDYISSVHTYVRQISCSLYNQVDPDLATAEYNIRKMTLAIKELQKKAKAKLKMNMDEDLDDLIKVAKREGIIEE